MSTIEATLPVKTKVWQTPNFAVLEPPAGLKPEDPTSLTSIPLEQVPADALHRLVGAWVSEIYRKAKKAYPPSNACACQIGGAS